MKLSKELLLRKINEDYFLIPVGQRVMQGSSVSKISESAYLILKELEDTDLTYDELLKKLAEIFEAEESDIPELKEYLNEFIKNTRGRIIIE